MDEVFGTHTIVPSFNDPINSDNTVIISTGRLASRNCYNATTSELMAQSGSRQLTKHDIDRFHVGRQVEDSIHVQNMKDINEKEKAINETLKLQNRPWFEYGLNNSTLKANPALYHQLEQLANDRLMEEEEEEEEKEHNTKKRKRNNDDDDEEDELLSVKPIKIPKQATITTTTTTTTTTTQKTTAVSGAALSTHDVIMQDDEGGEEEEGEEEEEVEEVEGCETTEPRFNFDRPSSSLVKRVSQENKVHNTRSLSKSRTKSTIVDLEIPTSEEKEQEDVISDERGRSRVATNNNKLTRGVVNNNNNNNNNRKRSSAVASRSSSVVAVIGGTKRSSSRKRITPSRKSSTSRPQNKNNKLPPPPPPPPQPSYRGKSKGKKSISLSTLETYNNNVVRNDKLYQRTNNGKNSTKDDDIVDDDDSDGGTWDIVDRQQGLPKNQEELLRTQEQRKEAQDQYLLFNRYDNNNILNPNECLACNSFKYFLGDKTPLHMFFTQCMDAAMVEMETNFTSVINQCVAFSSVIYEWASKCGIKVQNMDHSKWMDHFVWHSQIPQAIKHCQLNIVMALQHAASNGAVVCGIKNGKAKQIIDVNKAKLSVVYDKQIMSWVKVNMNMVNDRSRAFLQNNPIITGKNSNFSDQVQAIAASKSHSEAQGLLESLPQPLISKTLKAISPMLRDTSNNRLLTY